MKSFISKNATATFTIPPSPPDAVAESYRRFTDLADKMGMLDGEIDDAEQAIVEAEAEGIRKAAAAYAAGDEPGDIDKPARAARAHLSGLRLRREGLNAALDTAGNQLAEVIAANRENWIDLLVETDAEASARYDRAIAEARAAVADLKPARSAIEWVQQFDAARARHGEQGQFAGGRLRVNGRARGPLRGEFDPAVLLELAATLTAPPSPAPEPPAAAESVPEAERVFVGSVA